MLKQRIYKARGPRSTKMKVGDVFGRLTILELIPHHKAPKALCICECGRRSTPVRTSLLSGKARSCGCLSADLTRARTETHGQSASPEYLIYMGMLERCTNPKRAEYPLYGGRGIAVEYASFEEFYTDVGPRPEGALIDREDANGNYRPGNCRWVSSAESAVNKRNSKLWTVNGTVFESSRAAADSLGVCCATVVRRCNAGVPGWTCSLKYPVELGASK